MFAQQYYEVDRAAPAITLRQVSFFDFRRVFREELSAYYGEDPESFKVVEATWNHDDEYAEVVILNGRIVGAIDRPLSQKDVAAIWGVDQMEKRTFINRIRSLYSIDGDRLPELTREQQATFLANPVRFLLEANEAQSDAIMREVEARQIPVSRRPELAAQPVAEAKPELSKTSVKAKRKKKPAPRVEGKREMLLPITGGAGAGDTKAAESPRRRNAG
jgi:hypothetical protein